MDKKELRKFGFILACGLMLIFGLLIPYIWDKPSQQWPWIAAALFAGVAIVLPVALKPVYIVWMKIGHVLGWVNTRIILAIVFYIVFTPISLLLFIFRKDPMRRKLSSDINTYRIKSLKLPRDRLEKPF